MKKVEELVQNSEIKTEEYELKNMMTRPLELWENVPGTGNQLWVESKSECLETCTWFFRQEGTTESFWVI